MDVRSEKSFSDALRDAANNIGEIIRSEFRLAKLELRETASKALAPAKMVVMGAAIGIYALGFLLLTIMFALRIVLPYWLSAFIVFIIAAITAGALIGSALQGFRQLNPPLERTTANVKEQVQWAKQQVR